MKSCFKLQFLTAFLGNLFEHYDLALYSLLTPFFASIFFSDQNQISALIMTFGIIPLGMLARPVGAIFFGYIGDNFGRGRALFISLFGLGIVSGLLAFTPTYQQAGWMAPFLLLFGRVLQNFFGIGENLGGAIYLLEQSSEKHQDFISSLYGSSTVAGFLLASLGVSVLSYHHSIENGWRYLYLMGFFTAVFGIILRKIVLPLKTIPNQTIVISKASWMKNILALYWDYRSEILLIALVAGFSYATYSISLVFFNGFIPLISNVSREQMLTLNSFLLVFDLVSLPLFGFLSDRISRQKMMLASAFCTVVTAIPFFALLEMASLPAIIIVRMTIVLFGVWFTAPFHLWVKSWHLSSHRYSIISFGYALGLQSEEGRQLLFPYGFISRQIWPGQPLAIGWFWHLLQVWL